MWSLGFFHCLNPSGRTMVQGSTPTLKEISDRNISCANKGVRSVRLTNLQPSCDDFIEILGILESSGPVQVFTVVTLYAHLVLWYTQCSIFVTSPLDWVVPLDNGPGNNAYSWILPNRDNTCSGVIIITALPNFSPRIGLEAEWTPLPARNSYRRE